MNDILNKNVQIITMGENIKNIIYMIKQEIKRLKTLESEADTEKGKNLFKAGIKYYTLLEKDLQSQLDGQL